MGSIARLLVFGLLVWGGIHASLPDGSEHSVSSWELPETCQGDGGIATASYSGKSTGLVHVKCMNGSFTNVTR